MINFLRKLFCIHAWEYESDILTDEEFKVCWKCDKESTCDEAA